MATRRNQGRPSTARGGPPCPSSPSGEVDEVHRCLGPGHRRATGGILAVGTAQAAASTNPIYGPQGEPPFLGLALTYGTAVDSAGDVFVANSEPTRCWS